MSKEGARPLTAGGRSLAKKRRGASGAKVRGRRRTWWQSGSNKGLGRGKVGSVPGQA